MERTAAEYFGKLVEQYDSLISRAVPRYAELTARLVEYLPARAARVLELGCGTGNLSLRLEARYPEAELVFVDASAEMLAVARSRLDRIDPAGAPRRRYVERRFEDLDLDGGAFDLVTSCISLHHVVDPGSLHRRVRTLLAPGGTFAFGDQMRGGDDAAHAINWNRWLEFCREPGNCSEDEIESLVDHARAHDHYVPVAEHLRMLGSAGFVDIDCVWRNGMWGVVVARVR